MEVEKRKRADDGEVDGKRVKAREDDGEKVVTVTLDDEVEEFFAILRRVRVAVKYFKEGNNQHARELTESRLSSPSFERKDFEGVNGVKGKESVEDSVGGLDLNVDPCVDQIQAGLSGLAGMGSMHMSS